MIGQCDGNLRELQQLQVHTATRLTRYLSHSPTVCLSLLYSVFIILTHSLSVSLFVSVRSLFVFLSLTFLHSLSLSCLWIGHSPSFFLHLSLVYLFSSFLCLSPFVSLSFPCSVGPSLSLSQFGSEYFVGMIYIQYCQSTNIDIFFFFNFVLTYFCNYLHFLFFNYCFFLSLTHSVSCNLLSTLLLNIPTAWHNGFIRQAPPKHFHSVVHYVHVNLAPRASNVKQKCSRWIHCSVCAALVFITSVELLSSEREMSPAGGKRDSEAESAGRASQSAAEGLESAAASPQKGSGFNLQHRT